MTLSVSSNSQVAPGGAPVSSEKLPRSDTDRRVQRTASPIFVVAAVAAVALVAVAAVAARA